MLYVVVAIRDRSAVVFGRPAFVTTVGLAVRSFTDEVNREHPENMMSRHPEDFDLYELGTYNDETGEMKSLDHPRQIAIGKDVVR